MVQTSFAVVWTRPPPNRFRGHHTYRRMCSQPVSTSMKSRTTRLHRIRCTTFRKVSCLHNNCSHDEPRSPAP